MNTPRLISIAIACALLAPATAAAASERGVVSLPVAFGVRNTNSSAVPCASDGAAYVVRGHITGPRAALEDRRPSIAVYTTGLEVGEWDWRLPAVPGYDWPLAMARMGHVSLTVDMLGYGASGLPPGADSCWGSQADVLHQIVGRLRAGDYTVSGHSPILFAHVVSVGHDVGGAIAQIEAYSYGDVDALAVISWSDQGFTPLILRRFLRAGMVCAGGGEAKRPGGPTGYYFIERPGEYGPDLFQDADPETVAAAMRRWERNPCGYEASASAGISTDLARLGEIRVPVLLAIGAQDKIWTADGWELQRSHFTGSPDVQAVRLADTGHLPMLERSAPSLRGIVDTWLRHHRLG